MPAAPGWQAAGLYSPGEGRTPARARRARQKRAFKGASRKARGWAAPARGGLAESPGRTGAAAPQVRTFCACRTPVSGTSAEARRARRRQRQREPRAAKRQSLPGTVGRGGRGPGAWLGGPDRVGGACPGRPRRAERPKYGYIGHGPAGRAVMDGALARDGPGSGQKGLRRRAGRYCGGGAAPARDRNFKERVARRA